MDVMHVPIVAEIALDNVPLERIEAELTELAGHLAAAECRWLQLVAAYDRREGWKSWGCRSCAQWLSWRCGLGRRAAYEKLRVAHALDEFPLVREAFAAGRLSYSKARALTRVASERTEAELVQVAEHATAAHLESIAGGYVGVERRVAARDGTVDPAKRRRVSFDVRDDDPDFASMTVTATHEELDLVARAIGAAGDGRSMVDGVVLMAESFLAHGHESRSGSDRTMMLVHTDEATLVGDDEHLSLDPNIDGGARLLPETVRRLACDASFAWLLRGKDGEPVNVSSRHGSIPRALRRMVRVRDEGRCRFPGCDETRYTEVHHLVHRCAGGPNTAANLLTLCWFHHRLVHEGGWSLAFTAEGYVATAPAGRCIAVASGTKAVQSGAAGVAVLNRAAGVVIEPSTIVPQWGGESLDLGWAVTNLWYTNHPDRLVADTVRCGDAALWGN